MRLLGRTLSWDQRFFDPIILPDGKKLITLRDAARYITGLPKGEHDADEWQAAMEALLLVAQHDGPAMFARIEMMRALNRHKPQRQRHHAGKSQPRSIGSSDDEKRSLRSLREAAR
jgi:hypothetical protein